MFAAEHMILVQLLYCELGFHRSRFAKAYELHRTKPPQVTLELAEKPSHKRLAGQGFGCKLCEATLVAMWRLLRSARNDRVERDLRKDLPFYRDGWRLRYKSRNSAFAASSIARRSLESFLPARLM